MKILITSSLFPPEIVEPAPYSAKIAELIKKDNKVIIATYSNNSNETGIINTKKSNTLLVRLFNFTLSLYKNSKDIDIFYVQSGMAVSLPSLIVASLKNIPIVIRFMEDEAYNRAKKLNQTKKTIEEWYSETECSYKIKFILFLQKIILKKARVIITPSNYFKNLIINKYKISEDKVITNYNISEKNEILPFKIEKDNNSIFINEELSLSNNLEIVIKAIKILKDTGVNLNLYIAGGGKEKSNLVNLVKKLNLNKNIKFLGRLSNAEKFYYRKKSLAYIISGATVGTCNEIIKSFRTKTPIIAIKSDYLNEFIVDNETGLLVKGNNSGNVANSIKLLIEDNELREKIIKNSREEYKIKYNKDNHLKNLLEIFNNTLK